MFARLTIFAKCFLTLAVCSPELSFAQSSLPSSGHTPAFDVISIKENHTGTGQQRITGIGVEFHASNISLTTLIANAYGKRKDLLFGVPGWANAARYDIDAKVVDPDRKVFDSLSIEQRRFMLRQILVDRFHLVAQRDSKHLPVLLLTVAKGGTHFSPTVQGTATPALSSGSLLVNAGTLDANQVSMASLSQSLGQELNTTVIDNTNLPDVYTFHLHWAPDNGASVDASSSSEDVGPSIYTAVQEQLGLKLVPGKGMVETIIVTQVDRPTPN